MVDESGGTPVPIKTGGTVNPSWTANQDQPLAPAVDAPVDSMVPASPAVAPAISPEPALPVAASQSEQPAVVSTKPSPEPAATAASASSPLPTSAASNSQPQPAPATQPTTAARVTIPTTSSSAPSGTGSEGLAPSSPGLATQVQSSGSGGSSNSGKRSLIKILAVVIAGLVLVGAIVFGLWWFGIGWGAPYDPKVALVAANQQLLLANSYHIEGNLSLVITEGGDGDAVIPVQASRIPRSLIDVAQAQTDIDTGNQQIPTYPNTPTSYGISLAFAADRASETASQATIGVDLAQLAELLPVNFPTTLEVDIRRVDGVTYLRLPILSLITGSQQNKWLAFDERDLQTLTASNQSLSTEFDLSQFEKALRNSTRIGFEQVGAVQTAHYRSDLDLSQIPSFQQVMIEAGIDSRAMTFTLDWWVGVSDKLPYKLMLSGSLADSASTVTVESVFHLSNFGKSVTVVAPEQGQVNYQGIEGLIPSDLSSLEIRSRDAQRKNDLASVKAALELYYADYGVYPTTGGAVEQTNSNTTVLRSLVEKGYMYALPSDPLADQYWYGYKSDDGSSYELWSVLEDSSDSSGTQRGSFFVYLVVPGAGAAVTPTPSVSPVPETSSPVSL